MWLLLAFLLVPLIEIGLFIQVGGAIGLWPTLIIVILTAVIGAGLVKRQGVREIANLQAGLRSIDDLQSSVVNGLLIIFAAMLLLTPGFFTDTFGFALLVPGFRGWLIKAMSSRIQNRSFTAGYRYQAGNSDTIIEGQATHVEPEPKAPTTSADGREISSDH